MKNQRGVENSHLFPVDLHGVTINCYNQFNCYNQLNTGLICLIPFVMNSFKRLTTVLTKLSQCALIDRTENWYDMDIWYGNNSMIVPPQIPHRGSEPRYRRKSFRHLLMLSRSAQCSNCNSNPGRVRVIQILFK
jgi:hypothetical protein